MLIGGLWSSSSSGPRVGGCPRAWRYFGPHPVHGYSTVYDEKSYTSRKNVNAEGTTERAPVPRESIEATCAPTRTPCPQLRTPRNPEGTFRAYIRGGPPGIYPCVPPHSSQIYASLARQSETAATGLAVRSPLSSTARRANACPHRRADSYLLEPFRSTCSVSASGQGRKG